jgi:hypothetical protein
MNLGVGSNEKRWLGKQSKAIETQHFAWYRTQANKPIGVSFHLKKNRLKFTLALPKLDHAQSMDMTKTTKGDIHPLTPSELLWFISHRYYPLSRAV